MVRATRRWVLLQYVLLGSSALALLWVFEASDLDRSLARVFAFDPQLGGAFRLKHSWFLEFVMHRGLRQVNHVLVLAALLLCWRGWRGRLAWLPPRNALLAAIGMLLIPATVTVLKQVTQRYCPWDLVDFGGWAPYLRLFDPVPQGMKPGRCFPAGHASVGFLWLVWAVALRPAGIRAVRTALLVGLGGGAVLGVTRMLQGAHFLSHVLWSAWVAWAISMMLALALRADLNLGLPCSSARPAMAGMARKHSANIGKRSFVPSVNHRDC